MRYFATEGELDLDILERALQTVDDRYRITDRFQEEREEGAIGTTGELRVGNEVFAAITVDQPPLADEIAEMLDAVAGEHGSAADRVRSVLQNCCVSVAVQVLWQGRDTEETLQRLDPLWEWLFQNRSGLMQADGEGFYDSSGPILRIE